MAFVSGPKVFDFALGHPSKDCLLPRSVLSKAMQQHNDDSNAKEYDDSLSYSLTQGSWYVRSDLADWLNVMLNIEEKENTESIKINGNDIILTSGFSQGFDMLCSYLIQIPNDNSKESLQTLTKSKNIVLIEDPAYFLSPNMIRTSHGQMLPIYMDFENGININQLRNVLQTMQQIGRLNEIAFLSLIPFYQNPLGITYTESQIMEIIKIAHEFQIYVISDEVYIFLGFEEEEEEKKKKKTKKKNHCQ